MSNLRLELIISLAFAFFIMCLRMAGMCAVIARVKGVNPYTIAFIGGILSIPLMVLMVFITIKYGVHLAIFTAALTDMLSAASMGTFKVRYAIEVLIIALFIWVGVLIARSIAPVIESIVIKR